ncbi:MAG: hypothetical protein K5866_08155 [Treponema sp.]|nr:hypothetical protein [Treponema sp.]
MKKNILLIACFFMVSLAFSDMMIKGQLGSPFSLVIFNHDTFNTNQKNSISADYAIGLNFGIAGAWEFDTENLDKKIHWYAGASYDNMILLLNSINLLGGFNWKLFETPKHIFELNPEISLGANALIFGEVSWSFIEKTSVDFIVSKPARKGFYFGGGLAVSSLMKNEIFKGYGWVYENENMIQLRAVCGYRF